MCCTCAPPADIPVLLARSNACAVSGEDDLLFCIGFNKAAWRLHAAIFDSYEDWCRHQNVEPWPGKEGPAPKVALSDERAGIPALLDICLYFCLWTEAANIKHMPECMSFLFWCVSGKGYHADRCIDLPPAVRLVLGRLSGIGKLAGVCRSMRHSKHFEQLKASAEHPEPEQSCFPPLVVRGHHGPEFSAWVADLKQLRSRRLAIRNDIMTKPDTAAALATFVSSREVCWFSPPYHASYCGFYPATRASAALPASCMRCFGHTPVCPPRAVEVKSKV